MVSVLTTTQTFKDFVMQPVVIVDFHATWCGSCKMISPFFKELATQYQTIKFCSVDVDELEEVSSEAGVSAMPSFFIYKEGNIVDMFVGASREKLEILVKRHAS